MTNAFDLVFRLFEGVGVFLLAAELDESLHIVDALARGGETLELRLHRGELAGNLLGVLRVVPQTWLGRLHLKLLGLGGKAIDVKRLGNGLILGACLANSLGIIKFCHRVHHTFLYVDYLDLSGSRLQLSHNPSVFPRARTHFPCSETANLFSLGGMQTRSGPCGPNDVKDLRR